MTIPSPYFLAFAGVAALLFNLSAAVSWRQAILLVTNLWFLISFSNDPLSFVPFACFLAFGFAAQRFVRNGSAARLFPVLIILTVLAFAWLKRYSFIPSATYLPFPYLLIGFSYVFFRVLHLIIDSHQEAIEGQVSVLSYLNYTLNFTSLVSGPIQRYQDYRAMEIDRLPLNWVVAGNALERIVIGYFKVAIVSMVLLLLQREQIDGLALTQGFWARTWSGFLIIAIFPLYLFFNFSGYVDVVIGVARFFRIHLPENFDRPFSAENYIKFWGRWHMTLSNWLKTYVYNPLMITGLRRITAPAFAPYLSVAAFFITFFLVGVWHGRTSEFVLFGIFQGGGVAANKLWQVQTQSRLGRKGYRALAANPLYSNFCRGLTFAYFAVTSLWFWSDWGQIGVFMRTLGPFAMACACLAILVSAAVILAVIEVVRSLVLRVRWHDAPALYSRYFRTAWDTALVVITIAIIAILDSPVPDIVYKAF